MRKSMQIKTSVKFCWDEAFMCLRVYQQSQFRDKVKKLCKWNTDANFSHKKNGRRSMTLHEWENIKELFLSFGIDAEKGVIIKKILPKST